MINSVAMGRRITIHTEETSFAFERAGGAGEEEGGDKIASSEAERVQTRSRRAFTIVRRKHR